MWSEEEIEAPELEHIEKELTEIEFEKIKNNAETSLKDDHTLEQIDRPPLTTDQTEDRKILVQKMKQDLAKAKTDTDLKNILNQILTTIE